MTFKLYKRTGTTFEEGKEKIGEFSTFEDALSDAQDKICPALFHEGSVEGARHYWFSDNDNPNEPYKGYIVRIDDTKSKTPNHNE